MKATIHSAEEYRALLQSLCNQTTVNGPELMMNIHPECGCGTIRMFTPNSHVRLLLMDFVLFERLSIEYDFPVLRYEVALTLAGEMMPFRTPNREPVLTAGKMCLSIPNPERNRLVSACEYPAGRPFSGISLVFDDSYTEAELAEPVRVAWDKLRMKLIRYNEPAFCLCHTTESILDGFLALATRMQEDVLDTASLQREIPEVMSTVIETLCADERVALLDAYDRNRIITLHEELSAHPEKQYKMGDLCRFSGLNKNKLQCGFQLLYGETVFARLRKIRMHAAETLLRETNLTVETIAKRCGYGSGAAFRMAFKKARNVTPKEWRDGTLSSE